MIVVLVRRIVRRIVREAVGERLFEAFRTAYWPLKLRLTKYEPETRLLPLLLDRGGVCVDVGGNFGQFASHLARTVGPEGVVHTFEPLPYNQRIFRRVMHRLKLANVVLYPQALGPARGTVEIVVPGRNTAESRVGVGSGVHAEMISLDEWAESRQLSRLDFLKIDVEGYEYAVLQGARKTIERFTPPILCEITAASLSRYDANPDVTMAWFDELGYRPHVVSHGVLRPVTRWVATSFNYLFLQSRHVARATGGSP